MSEETLDPPLPPIDARTEAVAERLFWHSIWKTGHKSSHGKEPEQ